MEGSIHIQDRFRERLADMDGINVLVLRFDEFKPPSSDDYVTAPYKYESLEDVDEELPRGPGLSYSVLTQDEVIDYAEFVDED